MNIFLNRYFLSLVIGFSVFYLFFGLSILNPENISWLTTGDPSQHYSGWNYFRYTPWNFPFGQFYYDDNIVASIAFTDSNPILSILFKSISDYISKDFQFFGIWILICAVLQSFFIWSIFSLYTRNKYILFLSSVLMMFIPAWMMRVPHVNLMAFFIPIAGIYFSLRDIKNKDFRNTPWVILFLSSMGIHFYLFVMIFINWLFLLLHFYLMKRLICIKRVFCIISINLIVVLCFAYFYGYMSVIDTGDVNNNRDYWGVYKTNFLSPILSFDVGRNISYSIFFKIGYFFPGEYEGFNYYGLGFLSLFFIFLYSFFKGRVKVSNTISFYSGFFAFFICAYLISLSSIVSVGPYEFSVWVPDFLLALTSYIRASGRFVWIVTISLIIYMIKKVCIDNEKKGVNILFFITCLQIVDTSSGWMQIKKDLSMRSAVPYINIYQPLWEQTLYKYNTVRKVPTENLGDNYFNIQLLAAEYKQKTDATYLARWSQSEFIKLKKEVKENLSKGEYSNDTAYIFLNNEFSNIKIKEGDIYFKYQDIYVLAPQGKLCEDCMEINHDFGLRYFGFANGENSALLLEGWSAVEPWGRWSDGEYISLNIPKGKRVEFILNALPLNGVVHINMDWYCGDKFIKSSVLRRNIGNSIYLDLEGCDIYTINAKINNPIKPYTFHPDESRTLGVGLVGINM